MRSGFVAIGLIAGLLAACSSSGDPKPSPSTPVTSPVTAPTTTPSAPRTGPLTTGPNVRPGEKPPVLSQLGRQRSSTGATVVGAYYFAALDWAIATNDDWLVRSLALPTCMACKRVSAGLTELRARHEIERGGRIVVKSAVVDLTKYKRTYDYAVKVTYDEAAVTILPASGSGRTAQASAAGVVDVVFVLWRNDRWRVVDVAQAT